MLYYLPFSLLVVNLRTCRQTKRLTQIVSTFAVIFYPDGTINHPEVWRVIQKDGLNWTINGASRHARWLRFSARSTGWPAWATLKTLLNSSHVLLWYTWSSGAFAFTQNSLFAQIGDSNDKCSSSLEVECWNEDETHAAQQSPTQF